MICADATPEKPNDPITAATRIANRRAVVFEISRFRAGDWGTALRRIIIKGLWSGPLPLYERATVANSVPRALEHPSSELESGLPSADTCAFAPGVDWAAMDLEPHTIEQAGERCEECGATLTPQELKIVLESGGPVLCSIHAAEATALPDPEEEP